MSEVPLYIKRMAHMNRVLFQTARNGACKINTAPPSHPTTIVAPWHRTEVMGCGALKLATGVAPSSISSTPPCGIRSVISSVSIAALRK